MQSDLLMGFGLCALTEMARGETRPRMLAVAVDEYDWHAWLMTHGDFGCVQFERARELVGV